MMPVTRSSGVVRGGSTVPAIWIWLLHKQESWKVELAATQAGGVWKVELAATQAGGVWVSGIWISGAAYSRRRLTGLVWTSSIAAGC